MTLVEAVDSWRGLLPDPEYEPEEEPDNATEYTQLSVLLPGSNEPL